MTLSDLEGAKIGVRATSVGENCDYSLKLVGDLDVDVKNVPCASDEFEYVLTDGDGDSDTATLKLGITGEDLIVGKNVDDVDGSEVAHFVNGDKGIIQGDCGTDILIGDVGGSRWP